MLTATPALAEADWVQVVENDNGTKTDYIDRSSIRITGPIRRYWTRTDFVNEPHGVKQIRALQENNCASGQWRQLQATAYMVDGKVSDDPLDAREKAWSYVTPGTMGSVDLDYVCRRQPHRRIR